METAYRRLAAYQAAVRLADEIHAHVRTWPSLDQRTLGIQLIRAADSIGANIAEAAGRFHPQDRRRLLVIARGSLFETQHWLLRAKARRLLPEDYPDRFDDIARPLSGLIRRPGPN